MSKGPIPWAKGPPPPPRDTGPPFHPGRVRLRIGRVIDWFLRAVVEERDAMDSTPVCAAICKPAGDPCRRSRPEKSRYEPARPKDRPDPDQAQPAPSPIPEHL